MVMKICPSCGQRFSDHERHCATCAQPDGSAVALIAPVRATRGEEAIAISDQAVVSGEVIGHQEQHVYQGQATVTHIREVDETKVVHTCAICGLKATIDRGFHACPGCARTACAAHFDAPLRLCLECRDAAATVREDIYRQHALRYLADGRVIDPRERHQLDRARQSLGISAVRAATLEQSVRRDLPSEAWGAEQERQLGIARRLLLEEADADQTIAFLEPLAERHPDHQELQTIWLEALAERDPGRALRATEVVQADVPAVYIVRARLLAQQGRYQEGVDLLQDASGKPTLKPACRDEILAAIVELCVRRFLATRNRLFLIDAQERLEDIPSRHEPYMQALAALIAQLGGAAVDPAQLPRSLLASVHARRVLRLLAETRPGASAGKPQGRIVRSRARRGGQVWSMVSGAQDGAGAAVVPAQGSAMAPVPPEDRVPQTRTFTRLLPRETLSEHREQRPDDPRAPP
jgi:hypothetical protein